MYTVEQLAATVIMQMNVHLENLGLSRGTIFSEAEEDKILSLSVEAMRDNPQQPLREVMREIYDLYLGPKQ